MARHGHDPLWTLIAVVLGPLFVPIAMERVQRRPEVARFGSAGAPPQRSEGRTELRILVGLDGSIESERGRATVLRLFGRHCGLLVLAEVVHFEAAEEAPSAEVDAAERHLSELVSDVQIAGVVHTEVLAGAPGPTLRGFAEQQDMDLLVVGRRGKGVSPPGTRQRLGGHCSALVSPGARHRTGEQHRPIVPAPGNKHTSRCGRWPTEHLMAKVVAPPSHRCLVDYRCCRSSAEQAQGTSHRAPGLRPSGHRDSPWKAGMRNLGRGGRRCGRPGGCRCTRCASAPLLS